MIDSVHSIFYIHSFIHSLITSLTPELPRIPIILSIQCAISFLNPFGIILQQNTLTVHCATNKNNKHADDVLQWSLADNWQLTTQHQHRARREYRVQYRHSNFGGGMTSIYRRAIIYAEWVMSESCGNLKIEWVLFISFMFCVLQFRRCWKK